jgi:hypothetical protein
MKGAAAVPPIMMIGVSHHFLLTRTKSQSSRVREQAELRTYRIITAAAHHAR